MHNGYCICSFTQSTTMSIEAAVKEFMSCRPHEAGQTIQFGWFIFRIVEQGQPPRIESLDFRQTASFTEDFSEAERIQNLQMAALVRFQATECPCNLRQSALVSLSYYPNRGDTFLERQTPTDQNDSGWYVGVRGETRDLDDPASFERRSLYELTIRDMRMSAYWLLPVGSIIQLDGLT